MVLLATCALNQKTVAQAPAAAVGVCEKLASLSLPNTTMTSAVAVAAGAFTPPAPGRGGAAATEPFKNLPAFCRVAGTVTRAGDTDVKIEVWLPAQNWNGDFRPAASGFAGGTIGYGGMADILRTGAATANTNRGHDGGGPWKLADMASLPYHVESRSTTERATRATLRTTRAGCRSGPRKNAARMKN